MEMRKLFLFGLMFCLLFGQPCLAMESEDQVDVEVEDFEDLPLADEEIERRRTAEAVKGLPVDLWGEIAGWADSIRELVKISLTNYPAQVGARRSDPVLMVRFPGLRAKRRKFIAFLVGFLDLYEEAEGEGLVSGTPPWNDCALWDRHPGMFVKEDTMKNLSRYAGGAMCSKPPNRVMLFIDFPWGSNWMIEDSELDSLMSWLGSRVFGIDHTDKAIRRVNGGYLELCQNVRSLRLNTKDSAFETKNMRHVPKLEELVFFDNANLPCLRDEDIEHLTGLRKLELWDCSGIDGSSLAATTKISHLRVHCVSPLSSFEFSCLETLSHLVVLHVLSLGIRDIHLERLSLRELILYSYVTGSCFESEALSSSLVKLDIFGLSGAFDAQKLYHVKKMRNLGLSGCPDESGYEFLRKMPELSSFTATGLSGLRDEDLEGTPIYELKLFGCNNVDGSCFSQMPNLKKIEHLNCTGIDTQLVGEEFDVEYSGQCGVILRRKRPSEEEEAEGEFE